jgi:cytochrome c oxidase subunit 2
MCVIGLIAGAITAVVAVFIPWLPESASDEAGGIDNAYWLATIICIVIFAIVAGVSAYAVFKFRARPDDEEDGAPIHGNTRLEVVWTAVPTALVVAITVYSGVVLVQNEDKKADRQVVNVTAAQFAWAFEYAGEDMPASGELVVPVGRQLELKMQSNDVIHSFWVPEWRLKQDVVPGIETTILVTPNTIGEYDVVCTELCGLGHSIMRARARVVSEEDYRAWVDGRKQAASAGGADQGAQLFAENCGSCHALADAGTTGAIGPNLDESLQGKDAEYVLQSIVEPDAVIAPGFQAGVMPPNYGELFSQPQLDGLVDYLLTATGKE